MPEANPARRDRDCDALGRPANARPRDDLGRPLPRDASGPASRPDDLAPESPLGNQRPTPAGTLRDGQTLLDAGRPFEAHEVFEAMWKASRGERRPLWRGLAQLAVGITHARRGNATGARALLGRAAETLEPLAGEHPYHVDVDAIREWARNAQSDLTGCERPPRLRSGRLRSGGASPEAGPLGE
jgi:predicted metal-dependent hydrolase